MRRLKEIRSFISLYSASVLEISDFLSHWPNRYFLFLTIQTHAVEGISKASMAASVSASTIHSLNSYLSARSEASSHSTKLSSLASLQFPVRTRLLRIGSQGASASSRPRILPSVTNFLFHMAISFVCFACLFIRMQVGVLFLFVPVKLPLANSAV